MRKSLLILSVIAAATISSAQLPVTVTTFDAPPSGGNFTLGGTWMAPVSQFTVANGVMSIAPVSGGNPDDSGSMLFADLTPFDGMLYDTVTIAARADSGNASPGFSFVLFDSGGNGALFATFAAGDFAAPTFSTSSLQLAAHPDNGVISDIAFWGIQGAGTTVAFRFSFDQIVVSSSAIPEPSTYAALLALAALGFVAYRRRFAVAA